MTPLQAAARFAAYTWYTSIRTGPRRVVEKEAKRFSRESWKVFVPVAHNGLGRLLLAVSRRPGLAERRGRRSEKRMTTKRQLAGAF